MLTMSLKNKAVRYRPINGAASLSAADSFSLMKMIIVHEEHFWQRRFRLTDVRRQPVRWFFRGFHLVQQSGMKKPPVGGWGRTTKKLVRPRGEVGTAHGCRISLPFSGVCRHTVCSGRLSQHSPCGGSSGKRLVWPKRPDQAFRESHMHTTSMHLARGRLAGESRC